MPSLATRNSPAAFATNNTTATETMAAVSASLDAGALATPAATATATTTTAPVMSGSNAATCTFSPGNSNERNYPQQSQDPDQEHYFIKHNSHHYRHPAAAVAVASSGEDATCSVAYNGNSNLNTHLINGNMASNNSNNASTVGNISNVASAGNAGNNSETSSITGSISFPSSSMKKSSSGHGAQMHASREDVASLGSANSQISANNNGGRFSAAAAATVTGSIKGSNSASSSSNNNNASLNLKGSKENLLQNFYNGSGGDSVTIGEPKGPMPNRTSDNDDPGDGLGPLPPKWETAYTERGELYFIDHNTGTSHWLDPRLSKFQKKSLEDCSDDELPYGWEKIEDSLYGTYFIDHVNRRTQYENPVLEAKRRAAEQKQKSQPSAGQGPVLQTTASMPGTSVNDLDVEVGAKGISEDVRRMGLHSSVGFLPPLNAEIVHRGMQLPPPPPPLPAPPSVKTMLPYKFTRNPMEMQGERITATLVKSARGLGITIVGGDDGVEEFLQIKSIVPNGPAWIDGQLQTGDVLVYVNDTCVLGFTHHEMVSIFQSILPGETVSLEVCRGYSLPFDMNDPNTEVVTTIAVDGVSSEPEKQRRLLMDLNLDGNYNFLDVSGNSNDKSLKDSTNSGFILMKKPEFYTFSIVKGAMGFGFTIADSAHGQKVKKILDPNCCTHLQEGDVLLEINEENVRSKSHLEVVQLLKDCSKTEPTSVKVQRGGSGGGLAYEGNTLGNVAKLRKNFISSSGLFRSKTPTADLFSTQPKEILPIRPKTPLVDMRRARVKTPNNELNDAEVAAVTTNGGGIRGAESRTKLDAKSANSLHELDGLQHEVPYMEPYPKIVSSLSERLAEASLLGEALVPGSTSGGGDPNSRIRYQNNFVGRQNYEHSEYATANGANYNPIYGMTTMPPTMTPLNPVHHLPPSNQPVAHFVPHPTTPNYHHESCYCYDCQDYRNNKQHRQRLQQQQSAPINFYEHSLQYSPTSLHSTATNSLQVAAHIQNERMQKRVNELLSDRRRVGFATLESQLLHSQSHSHAGTLGYLQSSPQQLQQQHSPAVSSVSQQPWTGGGGHLGHSSNGLLNATDEASEQYELNEVTLERQALGFGFRIVGGTEEGSQVTVGHVVPGGAADNDHRINTSDEILSIDGVNVVNASHHKVVSLMGEAALRGQVTMILRRRVRLQPMLQQQQQHIGSLGVPHAQTFRHTGLSLRYPYDVIVNRHENEGFGFVIISSSNQFYGSTIGKLIPGSPADRCGELKVGDRIIAVNRIDIAGMSHGDVVNLIKDSGLHVRLTIGCPKDTNGTSTGVPDATGNILLINTAQASPNQPPLLHQVTSQVPTPLQQTLGPKGSLSALTQQPQL